MDVLGKSRSAVCVNFMEKPPYNFENLRKRNKDGPVILKAHEIDILNVNGKPRVSTRESLSENSELRDKGDLTKRGAVMSLDEYLSYEINRMQHERMTPKRHGQLNNDVENTVTSRRLDSIGRDLFR